MKIVVWPSDKNAVGYYRLGLPAMTLMAQESSLSFSFVDGLPLEVDARREMVRPARLPAGFEDHCGVLVFQRPMMQWRHEVMLDAQARGIRVVCELDDDLHAVDRLSAFAATLTSDHLRALGACCRDADLVTVSTPALARRYAPHGRVVVIPNFVPSAWLDIAAAQDERVVGWTGSIGNHRGDLAATHGGVGMAMGAEGVFRCWGEGNAAPAGRQLIISSLALECQFEARPWQAMEDYPHELAALAVGVAPLADTVFNRAKSWLKPLEMAACGVPCVMSPSAEYVRLHETYGIGVLAGWRAREWKREVARLRADQGYRDEVAQRGRAAVAEHLTIEGNAWRWAEAWAGVPATA